MSNFTDPVRRKKTRRPYFALAASFLATSQLCFGSAVLAAEGDVPGASGLTASPIKHVIILIGENRGFDHMFATYKPVGAGQTISNLLSKGIVKPDGTPGPNYALAQQYSVTSQPLYYIGAPNSAKTAYNNTNNPMPQPTTGGAPTGTNAYYPYGAGYAPPYKPSCNPTDPGASDQTQGCDDNFVAEANLFASQIPDIKAKQFWKLASGYTDLPNGVPDTRVPGEGSLTGPFPWQGANIGDNDYTGDQTHRFFQAWQQQDCSMENATAANPSGCMNDLFPFTMLATDQTYALGNPMGFYNMAKGQVSYFRTLANRFTLSDNFHQAILGGTYPNHMALVTGDALYYSDGNGNATTPPSNLVANPNPTASPPADNPKAINNFINDQNWVNCADYTQPGVAPVLDYLSHLPYHPKGNCQADHYYLINNSNPGYNNDGSLNSGGVPPSTLRTIGDELNEHNVAWKFFGADFKTQYYYCAICNPFQYMKSVMGDATQRAAHLGDSDDLIKAIQTNTLPAVSFGKPDGYMDGHPQSSKPDLFETYVQNILAVLQNHPEQLANTAVFITFDEAGGEYDSGYVQPIDFFGDGPRIPLMVLSPYSTGGIVHHGYGDHVSLLKFIERNWHLKPLTSRSRDNLPNPTTDPSNPYVPTNSPALDDLFDAFNWNQSATPNYLP